MSLPLFKIGDSLYDSLDLKVALISRGIHVHESVYEKYGKTHRISPNARSCNTVFLGDNVPVFLARVGPEAPFHLVPGENGKPLLLHAGEPLTEVEIPERTRFYSQKTSHGIPFGDLAVIQGAKMLSFAYLWPCELAKSGNECRFCHAGNATARMVHSKSRIDFTFPPEDIVEVIRYAIETDPRTNVLQLTAGSSFDPDGELERYVNLLARLDKEIGISRIGEIVIFLTPPKDPKKLDRLYDAGVSRIACDLDIWDEFLFEKYCPGKAKFTTHKQHLDALLYASEKYGPNRACSVFVAGLEPLDSLLEGETFLSSHGIVPLPSPWMPHGVDNPELPETPGIDYFRTLRKETAKLYIEHNLEAPGTVGSSVCLSRDIWLRREILANE